MAQTHLQRRNGCFYFRQKIPADLLVHFGQREVVRSLRTGKRREASAAGYEQGHNWSREFERIRAGGLQTVPRAVAEAQGLLDALDALPIEQAGERPQPKRAKVSLRSIDDEFVTKTCASYLNEIDGADAEIRANRGKHGEIHRLWSELNGGPALKDLESMLSIGPIGPTVHELLSGFLSDHNYAAGRDVPGYSKLCLRFLETLIRARKIVEDRNAGRPPNTEGIAPLALTFKANADSHGLTITGLHAIWAARQSGTRKTTDEFLSIIRGFQAFVVGQFRTDQAANVKQVHVIAYRNHLTEEGFKTKTITKKLSTIKTLFNSAIEDGMLSPSEVQSVKVGKPKKRGKRGTKSSKINTPAYNSAMKSRSKKGSKRRYITARDVLADIPSPAIARRLTVKPLSMLSGAKRLRAKAPASVQRKSAGVKADEPFLSPEEAAQLLHVSRTHINKLIVTGKLGEIQTEGPRRRIAKPAVLTFKAESKTRQAAGMATMFDATQRRAALGVFLDDWEKEHGSITSVELDRAGKELSEQSQVLHTEDPDRQT
jgi:excisionase family DNA binding protein